MLSTSIPSSYATAIAQSALYTENLPGISSLNVSFILPLTSNWTPKKSSSIMNSIFEAFKSASLLFNAYLTIEHVWSFVTFSHLSESVFIIPTLHCLNSKLLQYIYSSKLSCSFGPMWSTERLVNTP